VKTAFLEFIELTRLDVVLPPLHIIEVLVSGERVIEVIRIQMDSRIKKSVVLGSCSIEPFKCGLAIDSRRQKKGQSDYEIDERLHSGLHSKIFCLSARKRIPRMVQGRSKL